MNFNPLILTFLIFTFLSVNGQDNSLVQFIENKGQFPDQVEYKLALKAGDIYFEGNKITYNLYEKGKISSYRHGLSNDSSNIKCHAFQTYFISSKDPLENPLEPTPNIYNYFIGSDTNKWASDVKAYQKLRYNELYNNIDLLTYESHGQLKYDLLVHPGGDPKTIKIEYSGIDELKLKKGHLHLTTSLGKVIEQSPYAYQLINDKKVTVKCKYVLSENMLSFNFPNGYDENLKLIIDPILIFSTYTGSTADNWGFTATYDGLGNMYIAGIAFDIGYPVTTGAYQISYNGGTGIGYPGTDISVSKLSSDGTNLLYSTYFGGSGNENPHSIVCNQNGELYVFGSTSSIDLPTSGNAYDNSFNSGTTFSNSVLNYVNGTDAYVVKFDAAGNTILGSTYIGGSGNDAVNLSASLRKNYADEFRGEIIVDNNDECWITTTTLSTDFPIIGGAQTVNNGLQDAISFKLNSDLSSLLWSSYYGGSSDDAGYSLQLNSLNEPIISGGTNSINLFTSPLSIHPNSNGLQDGFVAKYNASGNNITNATYIGTSGYDQSYFIQVDLNDNIYLYGQTEGNYPIFPATVYNNPGSGQFLHKLSSDLTTTQFSTVFGSGSGINIAPSAFLVSDCELIYVSGWGGTVNYQGNTFNMPITSNAYQSNTDGSDFYLGVFTADVNSLLYSTYFGGGMSAEHVDGGTSRFDKNGNVYQAVCAGCGGNSDFPTTIGAWSSTNNSTNCNLGAFKFSLENINPIISIPQPYVCIPNSYQFTNLSQGGNQYLWDFGDGNTSTQFSPSHTYLDTGYYEVSLIVSDSLGCLETDTAIIFLDVFNINNAIIQTVDTLCHGDTVQLQSSGGATYQWSPSTNLSNPNIPNPLAYPDTITTYQVIATDSCGADTALITLYFHEDSVSTMNDTLICMGDIVTLHASGGVNYNWYPTTGMINPGHQTPNVIPLDTTIYYVDITTPNGCIFTDSVQINVEFSSPQPVIPNDTILCAGDTLAIDILGVNNAIWSPSTGLSDPNSPSTLVYPTNTTTYNIEFENTCAIVSLDFTVTVIGIASQVVNDTAICPGDTAILWASNASEYSWSPTETLSHPDSSYTLAYPLEPTLYTVNVLNNIGCSISEDVLVDVYNPPFVSAGADLWIHYGDVVELQGSTPHSFYWYSIDSMSCTNCLNPIVSPIQSSTYIIYVTDINGCINSDTVQIVLDGVLYVPNTFTPNSDGINDFFEIKGEEIKTFELWVFNRWGELIYNTKSMSNSWDGTYKNSPVQIDTYIWRIKYVDYQRNHIDLTGHINVLR